MILFQKDTMSPSFPDMESTEGCLVIDPNDTDALVRFAGEVSRRKNDQEAPPLVIVVDDLGWWRTPMPTTGRARR